jgi:hypothetical protein
MRGFAPYVNKEVTLPRFTRFVVVGFLVITLVVGFSRFMLMSPSSCSRPLWRSLRSL